MTSAIAVEVSKNAKTGPVSATYASQSSCPTVCPLRGAGCYAESGPMAFTTRRLNRHVATVDETAREEADAIDTLTGSYPLRVHVVGDCPTDSAARTVSAAVERYVNRGGQSAWTYTHAWRTVERESWGESIAVRASCESLADVRAAKARGYSTAMVVAEHPADGRAYTAGGIKIIPCPEQTRGIACVDCRLCWRESDATIAFAIHGAGKNKARGAIR